MVRRAVLAAVAVLPACGGVGAGSSTSASPSAADLEAIYRARTDSALARFSDADAQFMTRMIGHHAQALAMADLVSSRSTSPEVRRLAARITAAQESEIALMRQWLEERGRPAPDPRGGPTGAQDAAVRADAAHTMSPGMLTPEQMRELGAAAGRSFDNLFLVDMIQHHRGAVQMVDALFATPGSARDASTFRIASGIQVDQRSEIARMETMLQALDAPGPAR